MNKEVMISAKGIGKVYRLFDNNNKRVLEAIDPLKRSFHKDFHALHDINLEVYRGDAVGIIGVNGSGKSTLLKILTGVVTPTFGKYEINGKVSALLELGAGFNNEYTGRENIYLNGMMMGFSREQMEEKIADIIKFADIGEYIDQPVKNYSSGMFARLAFSVAISVDPEILIVDEALSVGDVFFQTKCYKKFDDFRNQGKTILFVSHDMNSMIKYCNRAILLDKGEKVAEGNPKEVIDLYKKLLTKQVKKQTFHDNVEAENSSFSKAAWKESLVVNNNPIEYGDRRATIIDFAIVDNEGRITNSIVKFEKYTVRVKVLFHQTIDNPIIAMTIKNRQGIEITGTNTMMEEKEFGPVHEGEEVCVSFCQRMTIQGGEVLLSLGCTGFEGETLSVFHRLYDVCPIEIISSHDTVGYFDMESSCEVNKL